MSVDPQAAASGPNPDDAQHQQQLEPEHVAQPGEEDEEDDDEEEEEPKLKYAKLTGSLAGVLTDGPSLSSFPAVDKSKAKRRASDGTALTKKEKAATGELKCEHCGKAYKHGSCLNKHL